MQAKHKFFLFVTYIYKRSETAYKFKKTSMYEFKNIMEDICFLTKSEKNCEGHPHSPRERKKKSMQAKHKFFLVVTYIYKRSETTYKFLKKKTSMYNYLQRKNGLKIP